MSENNYEQEYEIGDRVRFKDDEDLVEYVGTILIFYRHNGKYEIEIEDSIEVISYELPEVRSCTAETIYEKLD